MFLRVRGKGGSPENSQACVMYMRAFKTSPSQPTAGAYAAFSSASDKTADVLRPFQYPSFSLGIHTNTTSSDNHHHTPQSIVAADALAVSWKEVWNSIDILYDEVPLLPVKSTAAVSRCLRHHFLKEEGSTRDDDASTTSAFVKAVSSGTLAPMRTGNQKVVVCPHYFAPAAEETTALARGAAELGKAAAGKGSSSSYRELPPALRVVADVSSVTDTEKLAVELAWLFAFLTLQPGLSHVTAEAKKTGPALILVRLPFSHVPSIEVLAAAAAKAKDTPSGAVAAGMLSLLDFLGQEVGLVWEGCGRSTPPRLCFIGADDDAAAALQCGSSAASTTPVVYVVSDESRSAATEGVVKGLGSAVSGGAEMWEVPLKALKEGAEEEWDPYTQRERARLNFCPCCGDGDSHGHGHGHGGHCH